MPSGQIHDRITLWSLPLVTALTRIITRNGDLTLIVSGGFFFSGLMFSPDLDLYSRPFKRWGWLRWIWLPYQKVMRHRSIFSHGFILGTTIRILYLGSWLMGLAGIGFLIMHLFQAVPWTGEEVKQQIRLLLLDYPAYWIALFVGLELGAIIHSISDWSSSTYKRYQRHQKKQRQPSTKRKRSSNR